MPSTTTTPPQQETNFRKPSRKLDRAVATLEDASTALEDATEGEPVIRNMTSGDVSGYESFEAGEGTGIEIAENQSGDEIFETEATLEAGGNFTLLAVGTKQNETVEFQPVLLRDELEIPSQENASIRFVHASPDTPPLAVTLRGENRLVAENVSYRDDSSYVTLPAGNYTLEIRQMTDDGPGQVIETRNVSLEGGTVSSAIGVGFQNPSDFDENFGFSVALTDDVPPPETNETAAQSP